MCTPGPSWSTPPSGNFDNINTRLLKVETVIGATCIKSQKVTGLDIPIDGTDAVNKNYVNSIIIGGYSRTIVNTPTYTALDTDDIIAVRYTPTGSVVITLPDITNLKQYTIVDEGGNAASNNIRIYSDASDTIIGQAFYTINNNYNTVSIYNDGVSGWFIR